jgi:hypothetical protein
VNYETVVADLFVRFPELQSVHDTRFAPMRQQDGAGPHIVFGSLLLPALADAMATGNLGRILPICAFLEDVAEAAEQDARLNNLLRAEVREWLGAVANEAYLSPWLGANTRRICGYVPGRRSFVGRISSFMNRLRRWVGSEVRG